MVQSKFKSYDELPLFLNAKTVAEILGISVAGAYELLHQEDFPVLSIGSRLVVPNFFCGSRAKQEVMRYEYFLERVMQRSKEFLSSA